MSKILVVDDSEDLLQLFKVMLRIKGHEVVTVCDAADTIKIVNSFSPDLIMLDVILGDVRGNNLCKKIKNTYPNIPVLLMSASPPLLRNYKACRADDCIEKPFDIPVLDKKINALLTHVTQ